MIWFIIFAKEIIKMAETSIEERIAKLQERQSQLKAQEKALKAKQSGAERKARTKRLIEIGGAVESVLGQPISKEDLPKLIKFLKDQEERGHYFSQAMDKVPNASEPQKKVEDSQINMKELFNH